VASSVTTVAAPASRCETYCTELMKVCSGDGAQYRDNAHCLAVCASFPLGIPPSEGVVGSRSGNNLECRIYHTQNAALQVNTAHFFRPNTDVVLIFFVSPKSDVANRYVVSCIIRDIS
jgi:hypothetical protein